MKSDIPACVPSAVYENYTENGPVAATGPEKDCTPQPREGQKAQDRILPPAAGDHMKPGFRGRYRVQSPKSCSDTSTIGNVIRMPCARAMPRASLTPGTNADTCAAPLAVARSSAVLNAAAIPSARASGGGPRGAAAEI